MEPSVPFRRWTRAICGFTAEDVIHVDHHRAAALAMRANPADREYLRQRLTHRGLVRKAGRRDLPAVRKAVDISARNRGRDHLGRHRSLLRL